MNFRDESGEFLLLCLQRFFELFDLSVHPPVVSLEFFARGGLSGGRVLGKNGGGEKKKPGKQTGKKCSRFHGATIGTPLQPCKRRNSKNITSPPATSRRSPLKLAGSAACR